MAEFPRKRRVSQLLLGLALAALAGASAPAILRVVTIVRPLRLVGHGNPVTALAFSPSGEFLATGDKGGHVRVWSEPQGELRTELDSGKGRPIKALALSSGGDRLVAASEDGGVRLWSLPDPQLVRELEPGTERGLSHSQVAFSPSGRLVASFHDRLRLWSSADGAPISSSGRSRTWCGFGSLVFATEDRVVVSMDNVAFYSATTGAREPRVVATDTSGKRGFLVLSPKGTLAVSFELEEWPPRTPRPLVSTVEGAAAGELPVVWESAGLPDTSHFVVFSEDDELVALGGPTVRIFSRSKKKVVAELAPSSEMEQEVGQAELAISPTRDRIAVAVGSSVIVFPFRR